MTYRTVLFSVPVEERAEDETQDWVRRELAFEGLLGVLRAASRPEPPSTSEREAAAHCADRG